jgi:hypothetical protein
MITRKSGYLEIRRRGGAASRELEQQGFTVVPAMFSRTEVKELRTDLERVFAEEPPSYRSRHRPPEEYEQFRYATLNRSAVAQRAVGHRGILRVIEPLLGEDCHIIANTTWRNPPGDPTARSGASWHIDSGPHVPRPEGVPWDDRIPYPVFAIGVHIFVQPCPLASGPTAFVPGSHRSGQAPPRPTGASGELSYDGQGPVAAPCKAGDVVFFVSDVWHRRLPTTDADQGRFFLQAHYGRRDLAQRVLPTEEAHHLSADALRRARTKRQRTLVGLHRPGFYDA